MSSPEDEESQLAKGHALLTSGKRAVGLKQWDEACDKLSEAIEVLAGIHGELSEELIDPYILSGTALLKNAVAKSGVLGSAQPVKAKEEEKEPEPPASEIKLETNLRGEKVDKSKFNFEGDELEEDEEEEEEQDQEAVEPIDPSEELEYAFQSLDLARTLLLKQDSKESKKKLARVYSLLAEVASENEQLSEACDEYFRALELYEEVLPPHDRELAALHFFLALTLDFLGGDRQEAAIRHAERAKSVLEKRVEFLKSQDDPKESQEVEELLSEVTGKIDEMRTTPEKPEESAEDRLIAEMRAAAANLPQNDLNSLVKKKKRRVE